MHSVSESEGRGSGDKTGKNIPRMRFLAIEALGFCEASPGRPRSGSISPFPAPGPDGLSWGMPVAEAMADCGLYV